MINKIKNRAIQNKILINNKKGDEKYKPIIFFFNNDEIIYIGKTTKKVFEYISYKSKQIDYTHYYAEFIDVNNIDNIIAELILTIRPKYNDRLPKNTKYMSNYKAKEFYHIDKREFKKHWNKQGRLRVGNSLFLEKETFDNIFKIPEAYSINMPKVGTFVNEIKDVVNNPLTFGYDVGYTGNYHSNTNYLSYEEKKNIFIINYHNLNKLIKQAYLVTNIINSTTFEAYSEYTEKKQIFNVEEETWRKIPNQFTQDEIIHKYLESLN